MHLEIITPDKKIFEGEVESATFPGSKGAFQVLENHAALISSLSKGKVKYVQNDQVNEMIVSGGVVEVLKNKIILLTEEVLEEEKA
jgi:F-type H+-transporting ATPase subunit epsilon